MKIYRPLWEDGAALAPQQFQQRARWSAHIADTGISHPWGVVAAEFDDAALVLSRLNTTRMVLRFQDGTIVDSGHTDSTGNPTLNQRLSRERAESVRDWMRDTGDVPESCFAVQGYGATRPIALNDTPDGRAQNRRVEISLVPQADACRVPDAIPTSPDERDVLTQEMEK